MAPLIRVVLADDHPIWRDGVRSDLGDGFWVVGEAGTADEAIAVITKEKPDLVVCDLNMPGGGGIKVAKTCGETTRIVMLTVSEDEDDILTAVKAGAAAYVLKGAGASELIDVIRAVHAGEVYVAPALAWGLLREMSAPRAGPYDDLTGREREVLELVAEGLSNQEIGERLGLAEKTIKHHMTNILGKLHVRSRVEAALLVARGGLPLANDR